MIRPLPALAALMTLVALALYITSLASSRWLHSAEPNSMISDGIFQSCHDRPDVGLKDCAFIGNDCTSDFAQPIGEYRVTAQCNELRAVRAFAVIATIFTGLALACMYLTSFTSVPFYPLRNASVGLSLIAGICGLIAWAIYLDLSRHDEYDNWRYGYGFGMLTGAWVLNWLCTLLTASPWPYSGREYRYDGRGRLVNETTTTGHAVTTETTTHHGGMRSAAAGGGMMAGINRFFGIHDSKPYGTMRRDEESSLAERWHPSGPRPASYRSHTADPMTTVQSSSHHDYPATTTTTQTTHLEPMSNPMSTHPSHGTVHVPVR